jgi:hypothetical protein
MQLYIGIVHSTTPMNELFTHTKSNLIMVGNVFRCDIGMVEKGYS